MDYFDEAMKETKEICDSRVTECPAHLMAVMSDIVKAAVTKQHQSNI